MISWSRANVDTLCGYCGNVVAKDGPLQIRQVPNVKRDLVRGQCCAGPAPPDLPVRVERSFPVMGGFDSIASAIPKRTRGGLKDMVRKEWVPYADRDSQP